MYGDCQVMSTIGGNVVSSDSLFSSQIQNPNFNFVGFNPFPPMVPKEEIGLMRNREEMESGSGSDQVEEKSGNEQDNEQPPKKKRYHRHTARQIQEMEALFKECPHPDDKQRQKLSQELGLKPRQVKFWFQNRRTQMKAQQDRSDNAILRAENDNLKHDNYRLQAMLGSVMCPNCGGPAILDSTIAFDEQQLRLENARLKEELERVCAFATQYSNRPVQSLPSLELDMNMYSRNFSEPMTTCSDMIPVPMLPSFSDGGLVIMEEEKSMAMELAISSMAEMLKMCRMDEPLWIKNENGKEVLNYNEYERIFGGVKSPEYSTELRREATRDNVLVIMNSISLVDAFFHANKWMELFPSIVSRAKTAQVISSDTNGSLHLMYAEFQVLSPLVPTRETHFFRYCQQNIEEGTWAIVDFPFHSFHDNLQPSYPIYKRRPSGCIFQDMPNGYLKVTWIEHAEVEVKPIHQIFSDYIYSGMAFGAKRWLSVLKRQCERAASFMARNISDLGVIPSPEARKNLMKLAQRMVRIFCINMSTSGGQSWTALSDSSDETIRITTRKITEPGQPNGLILGAVSTTWLPYCHTHVFDLLRDERRRSQLDVLSNGNTLHEIAHIANASDPGNSISLLRINVASNSSQNVELILQESVTNDNGSLVVYTTISVDAIQLAMSGEDPSSIPLLPLGFVLIPDSHVSPTGDQNLKSPSDSFTAGNNSGAGTLLTVGIQVLASTIPSAKINLSTVTAVNNHLCNTVSQIAAAMSGGNGGCSDESGCDRTGVLEQG